MLVNISKKTKKMSKRKTGCHAFRKAPCERHIDCVWVIGKGCQSLRGPKAKKAKTSTSGGDTSPPFAIPWSLPPQIPPPTSLTPPPGTSVVPLDLAASVGASGMYFERQKSLLCGLHALNNIAGTQMFTKKQLNEIGQLLQEGERKLQYDEPVGADIYYNPDSGYYHVDVLKEALTDMGFHIYRYREAPDNLIGADAILLWQGGHWLALKLINGEWWVRDSLRKTDKKTTLVGALKLIDGACQSGAYWIEAPYWLP